MRLVRAILLILVLLLVLASPALYYFYWESFDGEQEAHTAPQKYFARNMDDFEGKPGLGPDVLVASQSGLPSVEFQWAPINLGLKEDETWRGRNLEQFKGALSAVPLPGTCLSLGRRPCGHRFRQKMH